MLDHAGFIIFPHVNGLRINQSPDGLLTVYGGLARTLREYFGEPLEIVDQSDGTFCIRREQAEQLEEALQAVNAEVALRTAIVEKDGFAATFDALAARFPKNATNAVSAVHRHSDIAVITPGSFAFAIVLGVPMPYAEYVRNNGGIWEPGMKTWTFRLTDGRCVQWSFHSLIAAISGAKEEEVVRWIEQGAKAGSSA